MNNRKTANSKQIALHELENVVFISSAIIFNFGVSGVYLASKINNMFLLQTFGLIVVLLFIPFTFSLILYIKKKAGKKIIISLVIILFYLVLEIVLDYILKIPFRDILAVHVPYIIIFYAAAFSMIGVSFDINRKIGFVVCITFGILIACLIYTIIF